MLCSNFAFSQVGINTTDPTATLDINGNIRIRTLSIKKSPDASQITTVDDNGNVSKTTPISALFSSGLMVKVKTHGLMFI